MRAPSAVGAAVETSRVSISSLVRAGATWPAQRHYSDAVGNAPAQAALHVISVAALPGNVFLGYGAVGAGHAHIVWIFPGEGCDKESPGWPIRQAAGLSRWAGSKAARPGTRRAEPALAPCTVSTRRPASSASERAAARGRRFQKNWHSPDWQTPTRHESFRFPAGYHLRQGCNEGRRRRGGCRLCRA